MPTIHLRPLSACLAIGLVGACTTQRATQPASRPSAPAVTAAPRAASLLSAERDWLQSWFRGTPVVVTQRDEGPLNIGVPREFSFERGSADVKPALGAVLDKLAESLRRTPQARLRQIAAPGDGAGADDGTLALRRASRVRDHLLTRRTPAVQLVSPTATTSTSVQLRVQIESQP